MIRIRIYLVLSLSAIALLAACVGNAAPTAVPIEPSRDLLETTVMPQATITAVPTVEPTATIVPILDGENLSLAWTYESGDAINHPPLRIGDLLIVVPREGPLLALDAESGVLRWQYDPGRKVWDRAYATDGRLLFLGTEGGNLVALDTETGEVQWQQDLGIDVQVPPLVAGDILYVPTTFVGPGLKSDPDGKAALFALNASDGSELWQFESDNYILQTPFLQGETVYVAGVYIDPEPVDEGGHTRVYALSAEDGSERWAYESLDGFPKQLYANDTAVAFIAYQDFANGIDTANGELLWRRDTGNWVPTLSGTDDTIYFGSANTIVHALDVSDGSVEWQHNIAEGTFNYVLGAPVRSGDSLIFLTQQGDIMALDATNGELRWHFPTGITARTGPFISGDWLYIGDEDGVVYAYSN